MRLCDACERRLMRWQGVELVCLRKWILLLEVVFFSLLWFLLRCGGGEGREEGEEDGCCGHSRDEHLRIVSSKGRQTDES